MSGPIEQFGRCRPLHWFMSDAARDFLSAHGIPSPMSLHEEDNTRAGEHLDDLAFAEMLSAANTSDVDAAHRAHLDSCEQCRSELRALLEIVRDPAIAAELARPDRWSRSVRAAEAGRASRRRVVRIVAGSLAAAAVVLLAVRTVSHRPGPDASPSTLRHATIDVAAVPRLVSPIGEVSSIDSLSWTSVPRADRYRVTIFNGNGDTVWDQEVSDTFTVVPAAVSARWSGEMRWRVKARTGFERWLDSDFGSITVHASAR